MKKEILHDALNLLDDDMIEAVEALRGENRVKSSVKSSIISRIKGSWPKWGALAACVCLAVLVLAAVRGEGFLPKRETSEGLEKAVLKPEKETVAPSSEAVAIPEAGLETAEECFEGVMIPKREVNLNKAYAATADMLAFFIYEGRVYIECGWIEEGLALAGECLGRATGTIDEWTKRDGYVELAGSVTGDFYAVNGYNPSFMLCMKGNGDSIRILVNDNDIALKTGKDLFEDRLHLTGNYDAVEYQTSSDWAGSTGEPIVLSEAYEKQIGQFVEAVNAAPFMLTEDVPLDEGERNIYDREIYHVFFRMKDGMTVHMRLYKGGYVRFQGIRDACVQVDSSVFEQMIAILER